MAPPGVRVGELPAVRVAVAVHAGGYDTIGDAYRQLGAWAAANAIGLSLPVRELYVVGPLAADDELRTEIHWPIAGLDSKEQT